MASDAHRSSRLTRRLYEAGIVFVFATIVALLLLVAIGLRTHGRIACATRSIATASARCAGSAEIRRDVPSTGSVTVIFSSDAGHESAER